MVRPMSRLDKDFDWQRQFSALVYAGGASKSAGETNELVSGAGLVFGKAIDQCAALAIYRRNLRLGGEMKLSTLFPLTRAYLGSAGFRELWHRFLDQSPPQSPVFTHYAVQFPAFLLTEESFDPLLREATSGLATIEFMSQNIDAPGRRLPMIRRYFDLYRELLALSASDSNDEREGWYRIPIYHPAQIAADVAEDVNGSGHIVSFLQEGEFVLGFVESSRSEL